MQMSTSYSGNAGEKKLEGVMPSRKHDQLVVYTYVENFIFQLRVCGLDLVSPSVEPRVREDAPAVGEGRS